MSRRTKVKTGEVKTGRLWGNKTVTVVPRVVSTPASRAAARADIVAPCPTCSASRNISLTGANPNSRGSNRRGGIFRNKGGTSDKNIRGGPRRVGGCSRKIA